MTSVKVKELAFLLVLFLPSMCLAQYTQENIKSRELKLRETVNENRKVYVSVGDQTAYYIHDASRLFPIRKAEIVTINQISPKKDNIEISYTSANLGKGRIRVFGASTPELFNAIIKTAFLDKQDESKIKYIANKNSGIAHFEGCNHLPDEESRVDVDESDIESGKYKKCSLCFFKMAKVSSYDLEMRLGSYTAGQVQLQNPLVTDDKIQNRVKEAGRRVLSKWVMPLKGYNYKFYAVDSEVTNAFAVPGGKIYITSALLDALGSEEELEAVLAHEIAHVELRHGYRQFRSAQKAAFWGGIAAAVAGVNNQAAFDLANIFTQIAANIVMSGHSRRYESESDAMAYIYFEANKLGKGRTSFQNVLKKLQYNQDFYQPEKQASSLLASHPEIAERIDAIEKSKMQVFTDKDAFYGYNAQGELVATVSFQSQRAYSGTLNQDDSGLQVIALVETTSALGNADRIKDISLQTNLGNIVLDNKEDTEVLPNDGVGASFVIKTQRELITDITGINMKLKNVTKWERSLNVGMKF